MAGGAGVGGGFQERLVVKTFLALCVIAVIILTVRFQYTLPSSSSVGAEDNLAGYTERVPTRHGGYLRRREPCTADDPCEFMIIADLDQQSRVDKEDGTSLYKSITLEGSIFYPNPGAHTSLTVKWTGEPFDLFGKYNEAGRGMELSELLLTSNGLGGVYGHI
eukprot:GHVQ01019314.1.p1 GENE.GHVQ01019314.1~~GHVQ01019314.1.p1  ORF type:complete len:163 (-),score=24.23 GHVQ01019314.1:67-555(-)